MADNQTELVTIAETAEVLIAIAIQDNRALDSSGTLL
jgi:hypothetical protein